MGLKFFMVQALLHLGIRQRRVALLSAGRHGRGVEDFSTVVGGFISDKVPILLIEHGI